MAAAVEREPELLGSVVGGKYRVERLLGRGGMGAVYAGTHTGIGKRVALKFLDVTATQGSDAVERFQREARAASAVESAHIVQIFDSGTTDDGHPYLVMELLEGEDLRRYLARKGPLSPEETVDIAQQILRGLARAHAANIIHRDLKPDNVFLCQRESEPLVVKIVDFGISKIARSGPPADTLTHQGTVLGTAWYMAPEQAQSMPDIDGRADLFSVGAIVFEALSGRPPHEGPTYESVLIKICTEDAPDLATLTPSVPPRLAAVVARALAREREHRHESAEAFSAALGEALAPERDAPAPPRRRWIWMTAAAAVATVIAIAAWSILESAEATTAEPTVAEEPPAPVTVTPVEPVTPIDETTADEPPTIEPVEPSVPARAQTAAAMTKSAAATARAPKPKAVWQPKKQSASKTPAKPPSATRERPASGVASGLRLNTREP